MYRQIWYSVERRGAIGTCDPVHINQLQTAHANWVSSPRSVGSCHTIVEGGVCAMLTVASVKQPLWYSLHSRAVLVGCKNLDFLGF